MGHRETHIAVIVVFLTCLWKASAFQSLEHPNTDQNAVSSRQMIINQFKTDLHRFLESERIRKKRQSGFPELTEENPFVSKHTKVASLTREDLPFLADYNLTFWTPLKHGNKTQVLIGTKRGDLVLFDFEGKIAKPVARSIGEIVGYKAKAFSSYNEQWFAILQSDSSKNRIKLYQKIGRGLERRQTITLEGKADFDLVTVKGIHYLAVATFFAATNEGYTYQADVALYHWTRTQFDVVATRVTHGARSLACWVYDGSLYLSVAQEINDDKNLYLGSPVFVYNAKVGSNLVLIETLSTKAPTKCVHFYVGGSHYLIFIGRFEAVLYWWAGNQFLELQQIAGTAGASDVAVLGLPNKEIVLVISLKEKVSFLTLNTTGYYMETLDIPLNGSEISSSQFILANDDHYALMLFKESLNPQRVYRLSLMDHILPTAVMDPLLLCLSKLRSSLEERTAQIGNFQSNVDKIWLTNKEQLINGTVYVHGSVAVENHQLVADRVVINVKESTLPLWTVENVSHEVSKLFSNQGDLTNQFSNAVKKSISQQIHGVKQLKGTVNLPYLVVESLNSDVLLNRVPVSKLAHNTLKISGSQNFVGSLHVRGLSVEQIESRQINNINISGILLLSGNQTVKGNLQFTDVRGADIDIDSKGVLNGIRLGQYVTANTNQVIEGLKTFQLLKSEVVDVHGTTNGEDLNELERNVITIDGDHDIYGSLQMKQPFLVDGDILTSGLINHVVNISRMGQEAVDKVSNQQITGTKVFSYVNVNHNLNIQGRTNKIDIDEEVLTWSTEQVIKGNVTFHSPITFEKDLQVGLLNGIDLDKNCVVLQDDMRIQDLKTFSSVVTVGDIEMADGITLDDVDPSELSAVVVRHDRGIVQDSTILSSILVLGNLTADGVNNIKIDDLPNVVYLKSPLQLVNVPVVFPGAVTMDGDLEAKLINNLDLRKDVIHVNGDEEILSNKIFPDYVTVEGNLTMGHGKLLDGADISSFANLTTFSDDGIRGKKTFTSMEILGSIDVDTVNGVKFSDQVMLALGKQRVKGKVWGSNLSIFGDLVAHDVIPGKVNGVDFKKFLSNAIMKNQHGEREITKKTFGDIKASSLSFSGQGRIDGVLIPEMVFSAVYLNSDQFIAAEKNFTDSLVFLNDTTVRMVNGMDLIHTLNRVVLTNRHEDIGGKKTVHGEIRTRNLTVQNLLNGVNLTHLSSNAVYKSRTNEFSAHVTFLDDINIGSFVVSEDSHIDGLLLSDVALTNEDEELIYVTFASDVQAAKNVFVYGLVNGCDLHKVLSNALLTKTTGQRIEGSLELGTLAVFGNVYVEGRLNSIDVDDLFSAITKSGDQDISGNFHVESGLAAQSLHLKGLVEGMDINYFLQDAVRKSIPQEISGYKIFNDDMEIGVLQSEQNILILGHLNSVNINKMVQETVWKKEFQVVHGAKTLNRVYANKLTVNGQLNGLKLPQDVVLTNTNEVILGPLHIMKDIVVKSNLNVSGLIDGVQLKDFLNRRVTVTGNETLRGVFVFKDHVSIKGDMAVDGMINDVVLEMVVKTNQDSRVDGLKQFSKGLAVNGPFRSGLINAIDLGELSRSILRLDTNGSLEAPLIFTNVLHISNSTTVDFINGVSITSLRQSFQKRKDKLVAAQEQLQDAFEDIGTNLQWQKEYASNEISQYAYFIKIQDLHFGPSTKIQIGSIVPISEKIFSQSMMMWASRQYCLSSGRCCDTLLSYSLYADGKGHVIVRNEPETGRYFHLVGPNLLPSDANFVVWTNTTSTQPTWCRHEGDQDTEIGSFESSGDRNLLLVVKNSPLLMDVKSFRNENLYIIAGFHTDRNRNKYSQSIVYTYNDELKRWDVHQVLEASGVLSMDIALSSHDVDILLALGTGTGSYPHSKVFIYKWSRERSQFHLTKVIPSSYVTSLIWLDLGVQKLLAVANVHQWPNLEECSNAISGGEVNMYLQEGDCYWIQSVKLPGVVSMVSFNIAGDTYLAVASRQTESIYILQWQGSGKFFVIQTIFSGGVRHINVYWRQKDMYLTVASSPGPSKIFKALVRGKSYAFSESTYDDSLVEMSDEAIPPPPGHSQAPGC